MSGLADGQMNRFWGLMTQGQVPPQRLPPAFPRQTRYLSAPHVNREVQESDLVILVLRASAKEKAACLLPFPLCVALFQPCLFPHGRVPLCSEQPTQLFLETLSQAVLVPAVSLG